MVRNGLALAGARSITASRGLVIGKFLPYHDGHAHLIRRARECVDHLTVLVCSLPTDPIPCTLRYQWVRAAHPDCRVVHVTEDVPQTPEEDPAFWPIWTALIHRHVGDVDWVFTSEHYGDELARRLHARHHCVDLARATVPVSATAIRADPMNLWQFIPSVVRPYYLRRVAILGAESSGKSTLAQRLAAHFQTEWVPEYGRTYCEGKDAVTLGSHDFEAIAWGQATWEEERAAQATRLLICDTELHTTCTWSDLIVGSRPTWMTDAARNRRYDAVLLLEADVPWVDDGTRVLSLRRAEHTSRLIAELEAAQRSYVVIRGSYEERFTEACRAIVPLLSGDVTRHQPSTPLKAPRHD